VRASRRRRRPHPEALRLDRRSSEPPGLERRKRPCPPCPAHRALPVARPARRARYLPSHLPGVTHLLTAARPPPCGFPPAERVVRGRAPRGARPALAPAGSTVPGPDL